MDKADRLAGLLKRLNTGENPESVKKEAKEFLAALDPKDLSLAEQKLIEAGLSYEDLRNLCCVHMEVLKGQLENMKIKLSPGHVIHTMVAEHDMILGFLDQLEKVNNNIQKMDRFNSDREEFKELKHIAEHLVGSEPHHKREEDVVFPEMEKKGVSAPQKIMRMEHEVLRARKKDLLGLVSKAQVMDFNEFKSELAATAGYIMFTLREHIFKENNILYPTAIEIIDEQESWDRMKKECDTIGYCCFTPER
ncbi:MAG: DUF438 domain-containing protein [Candidatus Omnitrophica bacterium]|nr:DUF438 domain-containing protein [Candidatus Omnitrophota bacterium]